MKLKNKESRTGRKAGGKNKWGKKDNLLQLKIN